MKLLTKQMVGLYTESRHYGGAEEGGWWYSNYTHDHSVTISGTREEIDQQITLMRERLKGKHKSYNSIASQATINDPLADVVDMYCLGERGSERVTLIKEDTSGQHQDHGEQHYE